MGLYPILNVFLKVSIKMRSTITLGLAPLAAREDISFKAKALHDGNARICAYFGHCNYATMQRGGNLNHQRTFDSFARSSKLASSLKRQIGTLGSAG